MHKTTYQIADKTDSHKLAEFLCQEGPFLLPKALRWTASALVVLEKRMRRIMGRRQVWMLAAKLQDQQTVARKIKSAQDSDGSSHRTSNRDRGNFRPQGVPDLFRISNSRLRICCLQRPEGVPFWFDFRTICAMVWEEKRGSGEIFFIPFAARNYRNLEEGGRPLFSSQKRRFVPL